MIQCGGKAPISYFSAAVGGSFLTDVQPLPRYTLPFARRTAHHRSDELKAPHSGAILQTPSVSYPSIVGSRKLLDHIM